MQTAKRVLLTFHFDFLQRYDEWWEPWFNTAMNGIQGLGFTVLNRFLTGLFYASDPRTGESERIFVMPGACLSGRFSHGSARFPHPAHQSRGGQQQYTPLLSTNTSLLWFRVSWQEMLPLRVRCTRSWE